MRRLIALILLGLILPWLPASAGAPQLKASMTPVELGLGDSIELANYTIQFYDVSTNWSLVTVKVSYPGGSQLFFLREGETGYFPSRSAEVFEIRVLKIDREYGTVILELSSPLRKVRSSLQMTPNETVVLNSNVVIKLFQAWQNGARFGVRLPPLSGFLNFTLVNKSGRGFTYYLGEGVNYTNYLYVSLLSASPGVATVDLFMPKLAANNLTIRQIPAGNGSMPFREKVIPYVTVYTGYLFLNESLPIETPNGTVKVVVGKITGNEAYFKVFLPNGTLKIVKTFLRGFPVPMGPVMLSLKDVDRAHGRVLFEAYAPLGSTAVPPKRSANVSVSVSVVPAEVLLGQTVAVYINVENLGPGNADDLVVTAPVPSGFTLVGKERGWSVGNLPAYSKVPAIVYILKPTSPGRYVIPSVTVTYYNETGNKVTVRSEPVRWVRVYSSPEIEVKTGLSNSTFGGFSSYAHTVENGSAYLYFNVSAVGGNSNYTFAKDAAIYLSYPSGVAGPGIVGLGDLRAGQKVEKVIKVRTFLEGRFPIKASLLYADPLGNRHELDLGVVGVLDTVPPKVIVKRETIKVYPPADQLPSYVNRTLKNSTEPGELAKSIQAVLKPYLPKRPQYWKISALILVVIAAILAYLAYGYYSEVQTFRRFLLRKRKSRPGGLPKKWKRDELEVLLRELRLELVRETLPRESEKKTERG